MTETPKKEVKEKKKRKRHIKRLKEGWYGKPQIVVQEEHIRRLKAIREKRAISQDTVAKLIGKNVRQSSVSKFERGEKVNAFDYVAIVDFIDKDGDVNV